MKINNIIQEEIKKYLNENPDSITNYTGLFRYGDEIGYKDKGAYGFGYVDGDMVVTDEKQAHDDMKDEKGKLRRRDYQFAGRIWTYDKIISFWQYPPPNLIFKVIRDLRKKLHLNINDSYKIETLPSKVSDINPINRGPHDWNYNSAEGETINPVFLTPTEYSKLGSDQIGQRSPEERAKQHSLSPILKTKSSGIKKTPIPIQQKFGQQIGDSKINTNDIIEEDPDRVFPDDGDGPFGYNDDGAFAFGYDDDDNLMISGEKGTHGNLQSPESGQDYRRESAYNSGRIWSIDKMISFWDYPAPNKILEILRDLESELNIKILNDPDYRIETLIDIVGEPVNYDIDAGHWTKDSSVRFLTPQEYAQLHGDQIQQRSKEELAKQHVVSPLNKPHTKPIKGSGSSKYGTQRPLAFRQALMHSESDNIFEQVEKILKEEYDIHDYYESRDSLAADVIQDYFYNNDENYTKKINWTLIPFQLLKSTWEDWVKLGGVVRYPKNVEKIENKLYRNIMLLDIITEMAGHQRSGEYYVSEENEEFNEVVDNYLNWKTQNPIDVNQLQIDYEKGGGYGNKTSDTKYYVSEYEKSLFNYLDKIYEENYLGEESIEIAKEKLLEKIIYNFYDYYIEDPKSGQAYISDYGLKPLMDLLVVLLDEENVNKKIPIIDRILNIAHQRSDLAGWLVQGGSNALSALSGFGELNGETINEKLEGDYTGGWYSDKPIEIYSNPKSIKRMDSFIRGIVDNEGNLYVANIGESGEGNIGGKNVYAATTHNEIMGFLKNKGLIKYDKYIDDNGVVLNVGVHRHENTNDFYLGESNSHTILTNEKIKLQTEEIFKLAKQKNPTLNFLMHHIWGN